MQNNSNTISGTLQDIRFHQRSFLIGKLDNGVSVKGNMISPQIGMEYQFKGKWEHHPRWGDTFNFSEYISSYPKELSAIRAYLMESCKWIGPEISKKLVGTFGEETLEVCKANPEKIARDIPGITPRRAMEISEMLKNNEANEELQLQLKKIVAGIRISKRAVSRIIELYGQRAPKKIKENPYQLIEDIDGIGFLTADELAQKVGFDREGNTRIQAGIIHILKEGAFNYGHTCLPVEVLVYRCQKLLQVRKESIFNAIDQMIEKEHLIRFADRIYFLSFYENEKSIAQKLKLLASQKIPVGIPQLDNLQEDQMDALTKAVNSQIFILTGAAGTGKTHTIKKVIKSFPDSKIALIAPTGKACKRMYEESGMRAKTIHKLLEPQRNDKGFYFTRCKNNPIEADIIVLDECFAYKQPILTEDGWRYIGIIVNNKEKIRVWSRNPENGLLELKPIVRWIKRPTPKKLLKISAGRSNSKRSARIIQCTQNHNVLTPYGYRRAEDLCINEEVVVRGYQITPEQRSILIGSLLGDGGMDSKNGRTSPQITITHGDDQREYLEFKQRTLGVIAGKIQRGKSGYVDRPVWRLSVNIVDAIYEIAQEMIISGRHPSGRKRWTPTNKFLEWIDEQALAIWYLDNGTLKTIRLAGGRSSHYISIHSQRFSLSDNYRLAEHIHSRFGLNPIVAPDGKGNYFLRFCKKDTSQMLRIVSQYTPACMVYKIISKSDYKYEPNVQINTTVACIKRIENVRMNSGYVFDIEVADFHNYIAGNIVVSNCSMVDTSLMAQFIDAVAPNTRLIMVGDSYQLPSVGPGNILKDMLASGVIPYHELNIIKRQDEGLIVKNCHNIKSGQDIQLGNSKAKDFFFLKRETPESIRETIFDLITKRLKETYSIDLLRDVQIISPLREKTILSCKALNEECQKRLNPNSFINNHRFKEGDKVIQTKNQYELDIINGDIGYIRSINFKERTIYVDFENPSRSVQIPLEENCLELAYAITVHKFQGSEAPIIIIPIHRCFGTLITQRNLLYTAVSRAQKVCILVGQREEIPKMIRRNQQQRRFTNLARFLREEG